jgi:hypothetical protein
VRAEVELALVRDEVMSRIDARVLGATIDCDPEETRRAIFELRREVAGGSDEFKAKAETARPGSARSRNVVTTRRCLSGSRCSSTGSKACVRRRSQSKNGGKTRRLRGFSGYERRLAWRDARAAGIVPAVS